MIYTATIFPYVTCYIDDISNFQFAFDLFVDSCFLIDIILNFFTVIYTKTGYETRRSKIVMNYLSSWFITDLFTTIPWQLLEKFNAKQNEKRDDVKILRIVRI